MVASISAARVSAIATAAQPSIVFPNLSAAEGARRGTEGWVPPIVVISLREMGPHAEREDYGAPGAGYSHKIRISRR
jgi:hypothetical protein